MSKCPCCGSPVQPMSLVVDLITNTATRLGVSLLLTPTEAEILVTLNAAAPARVSMAALIGAVYGHRTPKTPEDVIRVRLSGLRRKLAPLGVTIVTIGHKGWRLALSDHALPVIQIKPRPRRMAA